jgi:hypothetical protein
MMKVKAGDVYLFGLSDRNLELLKKGMPILIHMETLGGTGKVVIFYGETEEKMRQDIAEFIGPNTVFTDTTQRDS